MPGRKTCRWCGRAFEVSNLCREYCSDECHRQRRSYMRRERARRMELPRQAQADIQSELERLRADNARLCVEKAELVERLRREVEWSEKVCRERDTARNKASNLELKIGQLELKVRLLQRSKEQERIENPTWYFCERMKLRQTSPLPCGDRKDCYRPYRCERVPEGKTEDDAADPMKELVEGGARMLPRNDAYRPRYRIES